ncbi:MAG: DUF2179 domain-containing protein [Candidatus Cloacimonetes bacterium]|nr:DUF2179 domain-containing protein [Candidatus Cloacimonadota bacterium]MCF7815171.1 DUF2179 domain-containing protein [Candidatus Cloacimonadota bacterium]MCF7869371.1 DUF2179 domain-containing protein [Candidatus Cloacimonadota bacterium]MCF7884773.1 DUF2179 domain-containing protein [Candidatus Cloacimonadota bacterium]
MDIIFLPVRRKNIDYIIETVKKYNPNAFYTIEDVRYLSFGTLPSIAYRPSLRNKSWNKLFRYKRKGK